VVTDFGPQDISTPYRGIQRDGECRDMTTTKDTKGPVEKLTLH
jgi:hypothetical protein